MTRKRSTSYFPTDSVADWTIVRSTNDPADGKEAGPGGIRDDGFYGEGYGRRSCWLCLERGLQDTFDR